MNDVATAAVAKVETECRNGHIMRGWAIRKWNELPLLVLKAVTPNITYKLIQY